MEQIMETSAKSKIFYIQIRNKIDFPTSNISGMKLSTQWAIKTAKAKWQVLDIRTPFS